MKSYLDLVRQILLYGSITPQRAKVQGQPVNMLVLPGLTFNHDMSRGFPLLTTKYVPIHLVAGELEMFIKGEHNKKFLHERGNNRIWDEWQQPNQVDPNELGPIYGVQWRRWKAYREVSIESTSFQPSHPSKKHLTGTFLQSEIDQLRNLVDTLKKNPYDRRTIVTAWNPAEVDQMALPACHVMFQTVTTIVDGDHYLNLCMTQRSCDFMLGVPFNIASYGLLLLLLAKHVGMKPGKLFCSFVNSHIYENHVNAAIMQISREPHELPIVTIPDREDGMEFNLFDWSYSSINVTNYKHHPPIKMQVAV